MKSTSEARIAQLLELMKDGKPRTTPQAAEDLQLNRYLSGAMAVLFERKQVHIVGWVPKRNGAGGKPVPVYAVGSGENQPIPPRLTKAEYRKMQSLREIEERERLAIERARPVVAFRDPLVAAFYGEYRREAA